MFESNPLPQALMRGSLIPHKPPMPRIGNPGCVDPISLHHVRTRNALTAAKASIVARTSAPGCDSLQNRLRTASPRSPTDAGRGLPKRSMRCTPNSRYVVLLGYDADADPPTQICVDAAAAAAVVGRLAGATAYVRSRDGDERSPVPRGGSSGFRLGSTTTSQVLPRSSSPYRRRCFVPGSMDVANRDVVDFMKRSAL